ncbi:hypothetical protein D3C85_1837780 [compost metagenome]
MEVLLELDAHLAKMLRAYPHVLEQLRVIVRYLSTTHSGADVVMRNPHLVTDNARAVVVHLYSTAAIVRFCRS